MGRARLEAAAAGSGDRTRPDGLGSALTVRARAPGRANLIGEHTDYNGGFVLPCAIGYETRVTALAREDRTVTVRTGDEAASFDLDRLPREASHDWRDYARGVIAELREAGVPLRGAGLDVSGTLPRNAGLSSSASFEAALALALLGIAEATMERTPLAALLREAESAYAGTRCGIMDPFAVLHGRAGAATFLDTRALVSEHVPVPSALSIVVVDSMVRHDLARDGTFNERRAECEAAVARLRTRHPAVLELRDLAMDELLGARDLLPAPLFERCRHVVSENARVLAAADALRAGDLARFGALANASHESLRTDYAVSCAELDALVALARGLPGVYGARMTGAGFGGCIVAFVERPRAAAFRREIAAAYEREAGVVPAIYDGTPVDGASVLRD